MKPSDTSWLKLASAARRAQDARDSSAPYGFSTRVAALALSGERPRASGFDRLSWRVMGVACALAAAVITVNYSTIRGSTGDAAAAAPAPSDDPVAQIVDIAS